jgi:hypothetical protein
MGGRKLAHYVLEAVAGEVTNVEIEPLEGPSLSNQSAVSWEK